MQAQMDSSTPITEVNLCDLAPGDTVTVVTKSGSNYHLTKTSKARIDGRYLYGISVMTGSKTFARMTRPPRDIRTEQIIRLGLPLSLGFGGRTSEVVEIYINEELVASR